MDQRQETGVTQPVIVALFDDGACREGLADPPRSGDDGRPLVVGASAGTAHHHHDPRASKERAVMLAVNLNTRIVSGNDVAMNASQGPSRADSMRTR